LKNKKVESFFSSLNFLLFSFFLSLSLFSFSFRFFSSVDTSALAFNSAEL